MNHAKELLSIESSNLVSSPFNVRRHPPGQVEELAALTAAQGPLHNMVVTEQTVVRGRACKIKFAVVADESWRRALPMLQQQGRMPRSHEVLCELVAPERALKVSLTENSGREAMHPADDFEAFRTLIDEGRGGRCCLDEEGCVVGRGRIAAGRQALVAIAVGSSPLVDRRNRAGL